MGVEPRGSLKSTDVKLIGIFERNFGSVGDWLGHGTYRVIDEFSYTFLDQQDGGQYDLDQLPGIVLDLTFYQRMGETGMRPFRRCTWSAGFDLSSIYHPHLTMPKCQQQE